MADVFSAIILDSDYWDGTESWAGEVSEAARDSKYSTRNYSSLSAWESARDGVALAADDEYANVFGPWVSHDTGEIAFVGWTNKPANIILQTIGDDARSQDGKFDSNSCYVLENDSALRNIDIGEAGFTISIVGIQFEATSTSADAAIWMDHDCTVSIDKCYFYENGDQGGRGLRPLANVTLTVTNSIFVDFSETIKGNAGTGSGKIYNCTLTGASGDCIEDDGGTWTVKNCALFDNNDDFQDPNTLDSNASDQGSGEGTNGLDISSTWNTTCFTNQAAGDYSIESDSPLKDASDISQADDANVPSDDIIGTARNTGAGQTVSIGAFEYQAAGGGLSIPVAMHHLTKNMGN